MVKETFLLLGKMEQVSGRLEFTIESRPWDLRRAGWRLRKEQDRSVSAPAPQLIVICSHVALEPHGFWDLRWEKRHL